MGSYSQSFQKELPGIAGFLRVVALIGLLLMPLGVDHSGEYSVDGHLSGPFFKVVSISIFLASLASFFEVLGDNEIKRKKVFLGSLILVGGQFMPFFHLYSGDWIGGSEFIFLIADFFVLGWVFLFLWRLKRKKPYRTS